MMHTILRLPEVKKKHRTIAEYDLFSYCSRCFSQAGQLGRACGGWLEAEIQEWLQRRIDAIYVCRTWPQLTIGKVRFCNGLFETSDPQLQRLVEKAHGFGVHIEEVQLPTKLL